MTATETIQAIKPQRGKQESFLSSSADVVIYGGAAGGGKTFGLLLEPLRHINNSGFRAVLFRRTYPQIINPGGLFDESLQLYPMAGGESTTPSSGVTWAFPSGAVVRFAHLQHEITVLNWQGAQIALIGFDELTHFTEHQFWYMFSRNRSTCGIKPYIRAVTNPDASSWVRKLIDWWIDPESGYAIPERSGVVRWFVRVNGVLEWADDPAVLQERYPGTVPKSLTFIPARLQDNPILMRKDPGYRANLLALPLVERQRLLGDEQLGGNWNVMPSGGKVFNRAWFEIIKAHQVPKGGIECRAWDFAATEKKLKGGDPDYTAGVKFRKVGDTYYVMDCIAAQMGPADVDRHLKTTAARDRESLKLPNGATRLLIRWEREGGSAGKRLDPVMVKALDGYEAKGVSPQGDKLARAGALATQAEHGFVVLVEGAWNETWLTHMHHQPDWDHDDIMDASSLAYNTLAGPVGKREATATRY